MARIEHIDALFKIRANLFLALFPVSENTDSNLEHAVRAKPRSESTLRLARNLKLRSGAKLIMGRIEAVHRN
jgi:hypothetical protein